MENQERITIANANANTNMNVNPLSTLENNLIKIKKILYDRIIFRPSLETEEAQDIALTQTYLNKVNQLYLYALHAKNAGDMQEINLRTFPKKSREKIQTMLEQIAKYDRDHNSDTTAYSYKIEHHLHQYPFLHSKTFMME